jgi:hypothetical protein
VKRHPATTVYIALTGLVAVGARDDAEWVAALHPLVGVTVLLMAMWMHWDGRRPERLAPSQPAVTDT